MTSTDLSPIAADVPALRDATDSWVGVLGHVGTLARSIADTDFVPKAMRGSPAAVAAAILTGRELGVEPMNSLAHLHVIQGKVGMSAQLMRQLIQRSGHELRYVETTETRCVMEGRRRGTQEWTRVSFTADQAKLAKIDLGAYKEDKLVARATSRLARRLFADCLGGVPYLAEELADGVADDAPAPSAAPAAAPAPARRTAQRRTRPAPVAPAEPALPEPEPAAESVDMASGPQMTALAAAMSGLGYRSRGEQHQLVARLLGRPIGSAKDITAQEAHGLLDDFKQAEASGDPQAFLDDLLGIEAGVVADEDGVVVEDPPL